MFTHSTQIRVRYGETDQMGIVYYGNYASYLEVGRVEALRALGTSYASLEEQGIILPVLELYCKYLRPAKYDQLLTIKTTIASLPSTRIRFDYEVLDDTGQTLTLGHTVLVFIDRAKNKPIPAPAWLLEAFLPFFPVPEKSEQNAL